MTDTFRKMYKTLTPTNSDLILQIKTQAEEIEESLKLIKSREASLAMTNLEQAIMWATKAIVLDNEKDSND